MARVLLVDDDATALETFGFLLKKVGYDFDGADNGHEGIRLAQSLQPDVAIVDLRLPDLSGIDVLLAIRDSSLRTASVLLTGFWHLAVEFDANLAGTCACVSKPIFDHEFVEMVERALAVRKQTAVAALKANLASVRATGRIPCNNPPDRQARVIYRRAGG